MTKPRIITDLSKEYRPSIKHKHKRGRKKRGNHTKFTPKVRKEIYRRSMEQYGYPVCERCGKSQPYCFETAHLHSAGQGGSGSEPWNGLLVCGPKVNTGTCHNWMDETTEGREWRMLKREELIEYYRGRW